MTEELDLDYDTVVTQAFQFFKEHLQRNGALLVYWDRFQTAAQQVRQSQDLAMVGDERRMLDVVGRMSSADHDIGHASDERREEDLAMEGRSERRLLGAQGHMAQDTGTGQEGGLAMMGEERVPSESDRTHMRRLLDARLTSDVIDSETELYAYLAHYYE